MYCEIIDHYFNVVLVEIRLKIKKLEKSFLGARVWAPKPVYRSPKRPEYVNANKGINFFRKFQPILPCASLLAIYKSFLRTLLDYVNVIYEQPSNALFFEKIEFNITRC